MKPPKNFYSNLDRRKQGLPELPEASASDAGKILKVGNDGSYGLANETKELPSTSSADAGKVLGVDNNGDWSLKPSVFVIQRNESLKPYVPDIAALNNMINNNIIPPFKYRNDFYNIHTVYAGYILLGRFEFFTNSIDFAEIRIDRTTGECTETHRTVST